MPNIPGEIYPSAIKEVIQETGIAKVSATVAFEAVGKQRPMANQHDFNSRNYDLQESRLTREGYSGKASIKIDVSPRKVSTDLELKPLLLGTLLTNGSWKESFLSEYYEIKDPQIAQQRFGTQSQCNRQLRNLREKLGEDEFWDQVTNYIDHLLNEAVIKEEQYKIGRLTVGLELEVNRHWLAEYLHVYKQSKERQTANIDSLQHVGLPITYDALREIPLPKSMSTHEQLKAFLLMFQAGIIESHNEVGIHLNIGGLYKLDGNLFLIHHMATAAGLFRGEIDASRYDDQREEFHPLSIEEIHWSKSLYEDESYPYFRALPFVVRSDGVIEFRWLGKCTDYKRAAKGYETMVYLCEAIAAWQKVSIMSINKAYKITKQDLQLAQVWEQIRYRALTTLNKFKIPNAVFDKFETDAEECALLDTQILKKIATHDGDNDLPPEILEENRTRRQAMHEIFRWGRTEVVKILKSDKKITA